MAIGIFGGTFDPVHVGHLRTALELKEHLGLSAVHLVPCADPPHRDEPLTPAGDRLKMVELAVAGEPGLVADDREIRRGGLSYTVNTLEQIRSEQGHEIPLCLCIGMDSLVQLNTWHRWRELSDLAHIVVAARPGWDEPVAGEIAAWISRHRTADPARLLAQPAGCLYMAEMTLLPVSATELREALKAGFSIRYLTPDAVVEYINTHSLYR